MSVSKTLPLAAAILLLASSVWSAEPEAFSVVVLPDTQNYAEKFPDTYLAQTQWIRDNVEKVLMPIIHELYMAVPRAQRKYVELLRDNLEEIASPFVNKLSQRFQSMTTTEIQVCNMIRSGLRTKEIAELRGVSPATISRHREGIRRKLGIANSDANLATFLQTNM